MMKTPQTLTQFAFFIISTDLIVNNNLAVGLFIKQIFVFHIVNLSERAHEFSKT